MCGIETYFDLIDNPLTEIKNIKKLETQLDIRRREIEKLNNDKKNLQKQYWKNKTTMEKQYKQNIINLKKENRELNKERTNIKRKYNGLLNKKEKTNVNIQLEKQIESLKKLMNIKRNDIPVPDWLREAVFERDNYKCVECGHEGSEDNPLTIDHRFPRFLGGPNNIDNLKTLCNKHNLEKGASIDDSLIYEPLIVKQGAK